MSGARKKEQMINDLLLRETEKKLQCLIYKKSSHRADKTSDVASEFTLYVRKQKTEIATV